MAQFGCAASLVAFALLILCQLDGRLVSAADSVQILDERDPLDVEAIARLLCELKTSGDKQISRLSTVDKLVEFFDRQVNDESHALFKCKQQHGEALRMLQELLNASKENVCSDAKLALIEDFHNQFVSTHVEHKRSRKTEQRDAAPQLLRLFFMHYALEVDAMCKRSLINNIEWDLKQKFGDDIHEKLFQLDGASEETYGALLKGAMQKLTELYSVEKYEDVIMVWDLIENSYLDQRMEAENEAIHDEFDPITGEPIRLLVRAKTVHNLNLIKENCHYRFKPIYSKLILPIIKLADLGYSNNGEQFKFELEELRSNEQVKRWYGVTQLCEALLPVKLYDDPKMMVKDVVVLTQSQAQELDKAAGHVESGMVQLVYEPDTNSMVGLDRLESVVSLETQSMVKEVKSNLSVRDRITARAITRLLCNLKNSFLTSRVGRFFFPKQTGASQMAHQKSGAEKKQEAEEVGQKLSKLLEGMSDEDILKLEGASSTPRVIKSRNKVSGIGRRRRYRRKGDVDLLLQMRSNAISYTRTKSWSEIFAGWGNVLSALQPSRTKLIIVGAVVIGLLSLVTFGTIFAAAMAGSVFAG